MKNVFQETIEQFDIITLFRHENPDMDALGSQFGLFNWIKDNYPNKEVYVCGSDFRDVPMDQIIDVSSNVIQNSLAIILDTANSVRVDDKRYSEAKKTMKIDHHPHVEQFADIEIVKVEAAATCQLLTELFMECKDTVCSLNTATYLFKGILTDTLSFKTNNTTSNTLLMAAHLIEKGIDVASIHRELFDINFTTYQFLTHLRTKVICKNHVAHVILGSSDVEPFQISLNQARSYVSEFGNVIDFKIWCIFTEDEAKPGSYKGSIRSKTVAINEVASRYKGGGHANACGVKNCSLTQVYELLSELEKLVN